jgi:hypothetical protein
MLRGGDESGVPASHQYLTERWKKIFPEYADLAKKSDSLTFWIDSNGNGYDFRAGQRGGWRIDWHLMAVRRRILTVEAVEKASEFLSCKIEILP